MGQQLLQPIGYMKTAYGLVVVIILLFIPGHLP